MATLQRLSAGALAAELSKLPSLTTPTSSSLDAARIAIARAVASGQSADQLSLELGLPAGWRGIDLSRPSVAAAARPGAKAADAVPQAAPKAAIADWIGETIPLALGKKTVTRVAVLDHEPTALGGLEGPSWARALSPAATYGPITVTSDQLQVNAAKWIHVYNFTETVEFVRAGTALCVLPLTIFEFRFPKLASITSGSAWIAVNPFDASAPAGSFAGIAVQSGQISCDQPLNIGPAVVNIPAGATLTLTLTPAPQQAGPAGFPATATGPGAVSVIFPPSGTPFINFDHCAVTLYGKSIEAEGSIGTAETGLPAVYNAALQMLYLPGYSVVTEFKPKSHGQLMELGGAAPIESAGWALVVSESTTPLTLGDVDLPGYFAMVFGAGVTCQWTGLGRPEKAAGGYLLAQNGQLLVAAAAGSAPGVVVKQKFDLWPDQDSTSKRRCHLLAARKAGQGLIYALAGKEEVLELGAALEALVDRPLLATGARVPAIFIEGILALVRSNSNYRLIAYSALPLPEVDPTHKDTPVIYPMALDNALLDVKEPLELLISAKTDAQFNASEGALLLLFVYQLIELYLPDPYTGSLARGEVERPPIDTAYTKGGNAFAGFLLAEVVWTAPGKAKLRLADMAHRHPVLPPGTEAGSTAVPPLEMTYNPPLHYEPIEPLSAGLQKSAAETGSSTPNEIISDMEERHPTPAPLPATAAGMMLLDLSTRASQLGVEVETGDRQDLEYTIDGLSVRGPASLLPLTTLPAIAWEPMYNLSTAVDAGVDNNELLHPPGDGPFSQVRSTSATLIPISPLQSLQAVLDAGTGGFTARFTLPFGMIGALAEKGVSGTVLPELTLVQPAFPATSTPSGAIYTGAWQLSFAAPDTSQPDPVLAGQTYLRTQTDNPPWPGLSYGEMVLGTDAAGIFSSEFDLPSGKPAASGVPLRRYDLTGYGASTFSEWTETHQVTTGVTKVFFHVLVGRTSHEVIQVQSLIYPWAIKVIRTITIDRQASGVVQRYDSGWQAASDGLFQFPASTGITADQVHAGLISGVINVKNIQELGFPLAAQGTEDNTGVGTVTPTPTTGAVDVQPVTFDADVAIQTQHQVLQGGANMPDLKGTMRTCIPSTGITGFIPLRYDYHLSMSDMVNFSALAGGAGGPISATLNLGKADSLLRATEFDATPIQDSAASEMGIACAVRGLPRLSSDGSWSMASRTQAQAAPVALPATQAVPVVQPNVSGGSTPGQEIHFADPADIFRLDPTSSNPPETAYGFLQSTGTQSNLLSRPILTVGSKNLTFGDALNVAHAGALLGAISSFPSISNCLQFLAGDPNLTPITNQLTGPSLQTNQNLYLKSSVQSTPIPLISTSIADVNLYFYQKGDNPTGKLDPANVVIALGQTTGASWSLDVNHLAIGLVIPALHSQPVIWFQGGFHADADSTPGFPDLQVAFDSPLDTLATLFTVLKDIASVISPGGGTSAGAGTGSSDSGTGLDVHFSGGKLSVADNFSLPSIPLGFGTIDNVSLDIGTTLDILALNIDFLVGIGRPDAPCQWIADPLSGTICVQAGILNNGMDVLIQGGIGLGLAIDLGIASGSASIIIAVQLQINGVPGGAVITILLLLTGQAQVDVLGGLASASISLTAGLGFSVQILPAPADINLIGTASVGIHISICWVVNISWSGSWTFQKELPLQQLLP
jgi:hypothetical protein